MAAHVHWIVYVVLAGYMFWMLWLGHRSKSKVSTIDDFIVAGRQLPFYLAFATLFATWFGAGPCMGGAGTAYKEGLIGVIADPFAAGVSLILAGLFFVHLFRRLQLLTATEVFGRYYGRGAEIFASILMIPVYIGWLASQIVAFGFVLNSLTGLSNTAGIVLSTFIVLVYTFEGGMWAVSITAFYQTLLLVGGLMLLVPFVMNDIGGFQVLIERTPSEFWNPIPEQAGFGDWVAYAGQWMMMGLGCIVGQDLIQRSLSSKSESVARSSSMAAGVFYILFGLIPIMLGFAGRIVFPDLENTEFVIPALAMKYLSPLLMAVFICALLAVIMSSAGSALLAATSLWVRNVYGRLVPDEKSRKHSLAMARVTTVAFTVLAMVIALAAQRIYSLMVNSWFTLFVCLFVPVSFAFYWRKANRLAAWCSMIGGFLGWLVWVLLPLFTEGALKDLDDPHYYQAAVLGGAVSLLSYLIPTWFRFKKISPTTLPSELAPQ